MDLLLKMNKTTSIEEIKDRWLKKSMLYNQSIRDEDYKNLQYIDKLILNKLDNDTINARLKRYRKITITNESLNKKREGFKERMNKPRKRIDPNNFTYREIEGNLYYNQKFVWCSKCNRKHRLPSTCRNSKPIPEKCIAIEDHCWKSEYCKDKIFGMEIYNSIDRIDGRLYVWWWEGYVIECIVCERKGLKNSMMIVSNVNITSPNLKEDNFKKNNLDITIDQLKEVCKYIQTIRSMKFKELEKLEHTTTHWVGGDISIRVLEINKKIREIQGIGDYIIIE